ncbi:MAG: GDSL-type esterase/lipase family protein [Acidimicrobiales bacterium]
MFVRPRRRVLASTLVLLVLATGCRIDTTVGGGLQPLQTGAKGKAVRLDAGVQHVELRGDLNSVFVSGNALALLDGNEVVTVLHQGTSPLGSPGVAGTTTYVPQLGTTKLVVVAPTGTHTVDLAPARPVAAHVAASGTVYVGLDTGEIRRLNGNSLVALPGTPTLELVRAPGTASFAVDSLGRIVGPVGNRVVRIDTSGAVEVVAGTGTAGSGGDGGPATAAQLRTPMAVSISPTGVTLVADAGNHRIRRIDAAGVITTETGDGTPGLAGDRAESAAARLDTPVDVAAGPGRFHVIADSGNHRVREVFGDAVAPAPGRYVAMGDSYSSGTGTGVYPSTTPGLECRQSAYSYPRLIAGGPAVPSNVTHVACHNAKVQHLLSSQLPGQAPQLDAIAPEGATDPDVSVITVSIGGNDLHPYGLIGLMLPCLRFLGQGGGCASTLEPTVAAAFDALEHGTPGKPPVGDYLDEALRRAPDAELHVVFYPYLFSASAADYPNQVCDVGFPFSISRGDAQYLNSLVDRGYQLLDRVLPTLSDPTRVRVVDTRAAFAGHEACTPAHWIHEIVPNATGYPTDESFHPTASGYVALAEVVGRSIAEAAAS